MKRIMITTTMSILFLFSNGAFDGNKTKNECKKSKKKEMKAGKEHVCTSSCTEGKHVAAHGEKGHTCTEQCHKKKH